MDFEEELAPAVVVYILEKKRKEKKPEKRSTWVKPWLTRRDPLGFYNTLMYKLRTEDVEEYARFLRIPPYLFDELLELIETDIQKEATFMRELIPPKVKLAATLTFLSSGMTYADPQHIFRVQKSTLSKFVPQVCQVIYNKLKEEHLKVK